ncbi:uncharacterized protein G2W53_019263 [Senna tora]|uniref:Uncharacterized protein n=1 Tax=Senna tora TaxID=362788 RepID=A0A834TUL3_9FABA|nr:uncharacterized protein G2W53_019263 [Senna tora]
MEKPPPLKRWRRSASSHICLHCSSQICHHQALRSVTTKLTTVVVFSDVVRNSEQFLPVPLAPRHCTALLSLPSH